MFAIKDSITVTPMFATLLSFDENARPVNRLKERPNLLFDAIIKNQYKEIPILIHHGIDPYQCNSDGDDTYHYAIIHNKLEALEALLANACKVRHGNDYFNFCFKNVDGDGNNIVQLAAKENNIDAIQIIFDHSVPQEAVRFRNEKTGDTALHWAFTHANLPMTTLLLSKDSDILAENKSGKTAFYKAVENGDVSFLHSLLQFLNHYLQFRWLMKKIVNHPKNQGHTPLHEAISRNDLACVRLLLKFGAENKYTNCENSPLTLALELQRKDISKLLVGNLDEPVPETLLTSKKEIFGDCFIAVQNLKQGVKRKCCSGKSLLNDVMLEEEERTPIPSK